MEIKAIETYYNGYRFRSRLEARWAVFFSELGINWEYEKEGFELPNGQRYLPDFYLPQVRMWAEVKPYEFSETEFEKAALLVKGTGHSILLLIGTPENKPYGAIEPYYESLYGSSEDGIWLDDYPGMRIYKGTIFYEAYYCLTMYHDYPIVEHRFYCSPGDYGPNGDAYWDDTERAATIARSARFEYGENG